MDYNVYFCALYLFDKIAAAAVEISGVAILGSGLVFLLDWGYDTHQTNVIEIHLPKASYM